MDSTGTAGFFLIDRYTFEHKIQYEAQIEVLISMYFNQLLPNSNFTHLYN
jgi:hypothetical protein